MGFILLYTYCVQRSEKKPLLSVKEKINSAFPTVLKLLRRNAGVNRITGVTGWIFNALYLKKMKTKIHL